MIVSNEYLIRYTEGLECTEYNMILDIIKGIHFPQFLQRTTNQYKKGTGGYQIVFIFPHLMQEVQVSLK